MAVAEVAVVVGVVADLLLSAIFFKKACPLWLKSQRFQLRSTKACLLDMFHLTSLNRRFCAFESTATLYIANMYKSIVNLLWKNINLQNSGKKFSSKSPHIRSIKLILNQSRAKFVWEYQQTQTSFAQYQE